MITTGSSFNTLTGAPWGRGTKTTSGERSIQKICYFNESVSGIGLTIGSDGNILVNYIPYPSEFRDCFMHHTWKAIYMKFSEGDLTTVGRISNILYDLREYLHVESPEQFAI